MNGTIIGKEIKSYVDKSTNQPKVARTLYVAWDAPKHPDPNFTGRKCEGVYVSFELPNGVDVGMRCNFEYEIQQTRSGAIARLVDITPLNRVSVDFRSEK